MNRPHAGSGALIGRLALVSVLLVLVAASFRMTWHTDFWWQCATGRLVAAGGPPKTDTLSYTARGAEWIETRWVFCLALARLVDTFGPRAAAFAQCALCALPFLLLAWRPARRGLPAPALLILSLAVLAALPRFLLRPELLTYLFLAADILLIDAYRTGRRRALLAIPAIQILWVNAHTVFVLGPITVALFAAVAAADAVLAPARPERDARLRAARDAALLLLATGLACLANPYGARVIGFTWKLFTEVRGTRVSSFIQELKSPFGYTGLFVSLAAYKALIALVALSAWANRRRLDPFRALLWLAALVLSLFAVRNLALFALASVTFGLDNLRGAGVHATGRAEPAPPPPPRRAALDRALVAAILAGNLLLTWTLVTDRFYVEQHETNSFGAGIAPHRFPDALADRMQAHNVTGPVFATMGAASYLIPRGYASFFDPRIEVFPDSVFARYVDLSVGAAPWGDAARPYGFRAAVVELGFTRLLAKIAADPGWKLVDFDETAALLVPADSFPDWPPLNAPGALDAAVGRVRAALPRPAPYERLAPFARAVSPTPYHRVANLLFGLGDAARAEPFLVDAIAAFPGDVPARVTYGQLLEGRGDLAGARRELAAAHARAPRDPSACRELGRFDALHGRPAEARPLLERALAEAPEDALLWALLGACDAHEGKLDDAIRRLEKAIALDPNGTGFADLLAQVRAAAAAKDR